MPRTQQIPSWLRPHLAQAGRGPHRAAFAQWGGAWGCSSRPPGPRRVIPDSQYQKAPAESISCHSPWGRGVGVQKPASCLLSPVSFFSDAISAVSVSNSTVSVANPAVSVTNKAESQLTSFQLPAPGGPQDARTNTPGFIHLTKT